jgi:hypothetical protein
VSHVKYYATADARLDTIIGGNTDHVRRLKRARTEYDQLVEHGAADCSFPDFVQRFYGIQLILEENLVSMEYVIVDQKKYTVFLLKFST